ncbi:MAG: SDR family NAD(P)-dependent oxidoreductase [Acetobacteraceae bacterium]|nr:SDR family NAD(P)-dependent oxidoreductase [Acetobacteraceae bacterium]
MQDFNGKTAFITGGASGIGLGLAEAFLAVGMNVVLADIEAAALAAAQHTLERFDNRVTTVVCDTARRKAVIDARDRAIATYGRVHVLCNNAGVGGGGMVDQVAPAAWNWVLGVNLMGVIQGLTEFIPHMKAHGEPCHIVNTASMAGMNGVAGMGPYCASKFAVVSLSETLAGELAATNIGVSVLCPGWVATRIGESRRNAPGDLPPPPLPGPMMAARAAEVGKLIADGMSAAEVAARVMQAIRDDDLYIFTHLDMRPSVDTRFARIGAAFDKAAAFKMPA